MEFLKIYDVTEQFKQLREEGKYYEKYYIQEDTHDYHVFRIIKGNYDDENEWGYEGIPDDGFTIERENINKMDVLDYADINYSSRVERDRAISGLLPRKIIEYVTGVDEDQGYGNWDFAVYENIEECEKYRISEDYYEIIRM